MLCAERVLFLEVRNKKGGVPTEIGRGVFLAGDKGRFVVTPPNALKDSLDA